MRAKPTEIAALLGLECSESVTFLQLANHCEKGIPTSCLRELARTLGPEGQQLLNSLISPTAPRRRANLSAWESDCIVRLADCWAVALSLFQDEVKTRRFLTSPHAFLSGRTPMEIAAMSAAGAEAVNQVLGRLQYGSAA